MKLILFSLTLIGVILNSCIVNSVNRLDVTLPRNTKLIQILNDPRNPTTHKEVSVFNLPNPCRVQLLVNSSTIEMNVLDKSKLGKPASTMILQNIRLKGFEDDVSYKFPHEYQYKGVLVNSSLNKFLYSSKLDKGDHYSGRRISYRGTSFFKKALTFPFKYRQKVFNIEYRKRLPYSIETNFNGGFVVGQNYHFGNIQPIFNKLSNKLVNAKMTKVAIGIGLFGGLTTIKYTGDNTLNQTLFLEDRTVLGVTAGSTLLLTLNNFTVGLAAGRDRAFGQAANRNNWIYNRKTWYGLTFGFDFLKI